MRSFAPAVLLLSAAVAIGCGSDPKKPPAAPTGGTQQPAASATAADNPKPGDNPNESQINISDAIRKACGISDEDAFFAFNSAKLRPQDQRVLGELSKCFTSGPLAGKQMRLVGHADPRGEPEYNMVLGGRRAGNVKQYLVKAGMKSGQIDTSSRGAMDATGTDEASWAKDRKVDVMLAN
jgi:peptidoglycan-associated lipoprotein